MSVGLPEYTVACFAEIHGIGRAEGEEGEGGREEGEEEKKEGEEEGRGGGGGEGRGGRRRKRRKGRERKRRGGGGGEKEREEEGGEGGGGDGQVIETGVPEGQAQPGRQALILAQYETEHEPAPLAAQAERKIVCEPLAQAVAEAADASAPADLAPGAGSQNDVYPLASEPGSLVEAARCRPLRQLHLGA